MDWKKWSLEFRKWSSWEARELNKSSTVLSLRMPVFGIENKTLSQELVFSKWGEVKRSSSNESRKERDKMM